jgi:hypothetical protein
MRSCGGIRQVEDVKVDCYTTYAAAYFEWVDSILDEVAKELRPGALLAVGCIPDARLAGLVVTTGSAGRICAGRQWMASGALMPETTGQLSPRCGGNRISRAQT